MRIIAGKHKGRPLLAPKGKNTRPTSDRAREAIFNMLAHASWAPPIEGAQVIDLFAGSGGLGLEALSRGASFCLFVETDTAASRAVQSNIAAMDLSGSVRLLKRSATSLGERPSTYPAPFDLVFMDPPYNKGLVEPTLQALHKGNWLSENAAIMVETAANEDLNFEGWAIQKQRSKGAAKVTFLTLGRPS